MKTFLGVAIGLLSVIGFISSAEAITITFAEVQNGVAVVQGNKAEKSAIITWDGISVTQTTKGGSFSFSATVPADCVGTLSDGVSTIDVLVLDCTTVSVAPAPVPRTGQTTSYATGDDGDLEKGVASPAPRFTDNNNGTITDNLTGLIWLKNANCPATSRDWATALSDVASLNSAGTMNGNNCGDTSNAGSHQSDWRLPNRNELTSLLDLGTFNPALPAGHPNFVASPYWSSTTLALVSDTAWGVDFGFGGVTSTIKTNPSFFVTAVRGGS